MQEFDLWLQAFIFVSSFAVVVSLPCLLIVKTGRKFIDELGKFPTKAANIYKKYLLKIFAMQIFSFSLLLMFFSFWSNYRKVIGG